VQIKYETSETIKVNKILKTREKLRET